MSCGVWLLPGVVVDVEGIGELSDETDGTGDDADEACSEPVRSCMTDEYPDSAQIRWQTNIWKPEGEQHGVMT